MEYVADKLPFTICFCDGNHENFDLLNSYDVSVWNGGKVYIIKQNKAGEPKVIHLMRGKVYEMPLNGFLEYIREKAKGRRCMETSNNLVVLFEKYGR